MILLSRSLVQTDSLQEPCSNFSQSMSWKSFSTRTNNLGFWPRTLKIILDRSIRRRQVTLSVSYLRSTLNASGPLSSLSSSKLDLGSEPLYLFWYTTSPPGMFDESSRVGGITFDPDQGQEDQLKRIAEWLLLKLGADMGFSVWVARNDRSRSFDGHRFSELPALKPSLPLQFDDATNRTIELIDVLWLDRNSIVAAFEIESTTSIYSGLLRMADLIAMQPNLNIPLFLVAPEERREKVFAEVNRPTFSRLDPRLAEICRFISFDALRERLGQVKDFVRYLKPDFLEELSEACDLEQE